MSRSHVRRSVLLALALSALACRESNTQSQGSTSGGSTPVRDEPDATLTVIDAASTPVRDEPDVVVVVTGDAASDAGASEDAGQSPLEQRVRAMAGDPALIRASVRAPRGLSLIRYIEAPPSGRGGERHSAEHLCGANMQRRERELRAIFATAVRRADEGQGFDCDGTVCVVPGMEYEESRRFHFAASAPGEAPQLESIELVTTALMGEEWLTRMETYVRAARTQHAAHPCPAR